MIQVSPCQAISNKPFSGKKSHKKIVAKYIYF
jgi:hypothetical protein